MSIETTQYIVHIAPLSQFQQDIRTYHITIKGLAAVAQKAKVKTLML